LEPLTRPKDLNRKRSKGKLAATLSEELPHINTEFKQSRPHHIPVKSYFHWSKPADCEVKAQRHLVTVNQRYFSIKTLRNFKNRF
jgi:hypothetical protein